jgi:FAD/FMN-containing dehydrogenase
MDDIKSELAQSADHLLSGDRSSITTSSVLNRGILSDPCSRGNADLISNLKKIVGARHVLTTLSSTRRFRRGFPSAHGACFECTPKEGETAFLLRFAAAGAAIRYRAVHRRHVSGMVALDVAFPRNERSWLESLPDSIAGKLVHKLYYGHFFCHVFHQDYVIKQGFDPLEVEHEMWRILDQRNAKYPAEHNVGHLYHAKPSLVNHYKSLDPSNSFNPGIGHTSKCAHWR